MTLLQTAVIRRLRDAGYNGIADAAKDRWSHGEAVQMPNTVSEREKELRAGFTEKANLQATSEPT
jgi:hypothetical protein